MPLTHSVLDVYFEIVQDLRTYLSELLDLESCLEESNTLNFAPTDTDTPPYHTLINTTYVTLKHSVEDDSSRRKLKAFPPMMRMREIIDKAQERLFSKTKGRSSNVIMSGYRLASNHGERGRRDMTRLGIVNFFVNTIVTALQSPEWEQLLQRIGADAMLHLLTETYVFVSLPNNCLCQMTGEPIIYMSPPDHMVAKHKMLTDSEKVPAVRHKKRKLSGHKDDERPSKRLRIQESIKSVSSIVTGNASSKKPPLKIAQFSPADISFVRARLFYARPTRIPHTNSIMAGLPPNHILNRLNPMYRKIPKVTPELYKDPDPRKQAEDARHLAKYIFPRQYGLSSPFYSLARPTKEAFKFPDYSDRGSEIMVRGPCKTPKRLKETLALLEKMIWRHGKCGYRPLRDEACPSKVKTDEKRPLDSGVILEMMSEHSSQIRSQVSFSDANCSVDSHGRSIAPHGFSQAENHVKSKPRFTEFACSHVEVYRYAVLVTKAVIPKAFWGCEKNFRHILRHVHAFITCRRYETTSLHRILQGFSTSECEWLAPSSLQSRVPVTDSLKRRELLEEFLFWYFDSFLLPLLKTTFYVTESSAFRNRVLYFRQDDWEALCAPLIERLTLGTFHKIPQSEAEEILRQRKLGFSFVRLLPKDTGVRPIVNLRRRKPTRKGLHAPPEQSINQILQAAFNILTYEKKTQPSLLGASVFGPNEVYHRLKDFKLRLLSGCSTGNLPKLYFVKIDVKACFDTIEQTKLLEILRDLISEDTYMLQKHGQVMPVAGKIKRTAKNSALLAVTHLDHRGKDDHVHFLTYAAELAGLLKHTIFVDQVVYPTSKKEEILALLEEHITENIVKIGQDYFRQVIGIPQGSVLSALLCSFFYGDLEKRFYKYTEDPQSVLVRLIDDYLFVTTSLSKARNFLDMMQKGHPEYGCFISKEKTMTNFEYDDQIMNVTTPLQKSFPWCGFLIGMKDLSVSVDYSRYQHTPMMDTLTVERGRRPGASFSYKMLQLVKARVHVIYCDSVLNTDHTVYLNIYQNFVLAAIKMHDYIRSWGLNAAKNSTFVHNTVRQMICYTYATMRNRASNKVARMGAAKSNVQKTAVIWLGTHAFHTVLSRKPTAYRSLIKSLAFELSLPKYRRSRKRFRGVIIEGLALITQMSF